MTRKPKIVNLTNMTELSPKRRSLVVTWPLAYQYVCTPLAKDIAAIFA